VTLIVRLAVMMFGKLAVASTALGTPSVQLFHTS
jgi:hypothetical protein